MSYSGDQANAKETNPQQLYQVAEKDSELVYNPMYESQGPTDAKIQRKTSDEVYEITW